MVFYVQVGECAMYVGAHLLARLGGPKGPDDGDLWCDLLLRLIIAFDNR